MWFQDKGEQRAEVAVLCHCHLPRVIWRPKGWLGRSKTASGKPAMARNSQKMVLLLFRPVEAQVAGALGSFVQAVASYRAKTTSTYILVTSCTCCCRPTYSCFTATMMTATMTVAFTSAMCIVSVSHDILCFFCFFLQLHLGNTKQF